MNRLQLFAVAALAAISLSTPTACSQSDDDSRSTRRAITQSQAIATDFLRTELALSPETASRLNMEAYLGPAAIYALDNHSQAGFERRRLVRIELLQRLRQRPRLPQEHPLTRDLAVAEAALVDLISLEQLGYGRFGYADQRPYAIDAYSGVWIEGPHLLAYQQSINNLEQASAFITRLQSLSAAIEDTRRRLIADRAAGLEMPRALAEETHRRISILIGDDASALDLLASTFAALSLDLDELEPGQREQLVIVVQNEIADRLRPALRDLSATIAEFTEAASDQAGIWAQPKGQDLFLGILNASTGEALNSERLHVRHVEDVVVHAQALRDALILPVADETAPTLQTDPERPARLSALLPWFETRVSDPAQATMVTGDPASAPDVIRELAPTSIWRVIGKTPVFEAQASKITAYQALWQSQPYLTWRTEGGGELPAYRRVTEYTAIDEAWRLYVWHTLGGDDDAPLDRAAHVSIELIQTALAAADTGIHLDRWSLPDATNYVAENTGLNEPLARQLVLRIMARPGHHTSVIAAFHRFQTLSERAQAVLGERYSETDFQRTLIQPGPRPLPLIEADIEAWYGARLSN